ncbi:histidine phosphatase family protein [Pseudoteredinibacter isoporae]|uniref:Broad specificity phosphatase PhoE n=1 Tax=Pseudoteredinibacter isoporae TaxID=570281 RepID=A0A7X0JTJ5_9GAMM|nr:histidine phosphatase family protein [Pseudoteredinibacter isoporae]MBB6521453.1 broad specificity phosphatase PhoE [Pseudoteredinibacter isoporae]NHO87007.1 histidine phosphatase family protein [Pseudoteredinibacter isoporae]NIB24540.1 histidine phosphatase family protein [Pseudoteredinibacter isoporae]
MSKILLVRHGQAAANWGEETDPGLSELGQNQAASIQTALSPYTNFSVLSSPKARASETARIAMPGTQIDIDSRFTEIPSGDRSLADRGGWLRQIFKQNWSEQEAQVNAWRGGILDALYQQSDGIIFCHFVVINAVVAAARKDDHVMQCRPDYCSIWEFETEGKSIRLISPGAEDESLVL